MMNQISISLLATVAALSGCGVKEAKKAISALSAEDQSEFTTQSMSEAISAASAGDSEGSAAFALALAGSPDTFKSRTRTCEVQSDGSALVTVKSELEMEKSPKSGRAVSVAVTLKGQSEEKRVWSDADGVSCRDSERADVNLKNNASAYALKVSIERSREHTLSQTNLKSGKSLTSSRTFSLKAERSISFSSYSEEGGFSLIEKKVSGKSTRTFAFTKKDGSQGEGSFSSETSSEQPVIVRVRRSLSDKSIASREIVSGVRKNTHNDGSISEVSFSNLLIEGSGSDSLLKSGSYAIKLFDASGAATGTISCSVNDGDISCTDASGAAVEQEEPTIDPSDEMS